MSNKVSSKISKKNEWWISENRHMELRYFCLQYKEWQALCNSVRAGSSSVVEYKSKTNEISSLIEDEVIRRERYLQKMRCIEEAAQLCDSGFDEYILKAVIEGRRYEYMRTMCDIPCGRNLFYKTLRKYFWILDKLVDRMN